MKKTINIAIVGAVLVGLTATAFPPASSAATVRIGGACPKAGQIAKIGTSSLTCTKSGKKLVWQATAVPTTVAPVTTAAPAPAAPSAPASDIVVGGIYSRTGPSPFPNAYETADAYFKELNDKGGINGHKIKWVGADDATNAQNNATITKRMIDQDKVVAFLELAETGIVGGAPVAHDAKVPIIACYSQPVCFKDENIFPIAGYIQNLRASLLTDMLQANNNKKLAILTVAAPTAILAADSVKAAAKAKGIDVVSDQQYQVTETDFTAYVSKVIASGTQVLDCLCTFATVLSINKALQQQGYQGDFLAPSFDASYPSQIGAYANGRFYMVSVMGGINAGAAADKMQAIVKKWSPGTNSEHFGALASWTTAEIFTEAVRRLGDKPVTSQSIADSLNTLSNYSTTYSSPLTYAPGGVHKDPGRCLQVLITTGNKLVPALGPRFNCAATPATPS